MRATIVALLAVLVGTPAFLLTSASPAAAAPESAEWEFFDMMNAERQANGLPALQMVGGIADIAEQWTGVMVGNGGLSHRPDLPNRVAVYAPNWRRLGENVGRGGTVAAVHQAFMNSAGHRANILEPQYNYVGIGATVANGQVWVTVDFLTNDSPLATVSRTPAQTIIQIRPDGSLGSSPDLVAQRSSSRLDAVVTGTDGNVYWTASTGGAFGSWVFLGAPPSGVQGDPSLISWAPGRFDLFVRGGDNRLWQRFSTNNGASWSGWLMPVGPNGTLGSAPEVMSWAPGRIDVFVRGTDGQVYQQFYENGWAAGWIPMGSSPGGVQDTPAAVSWTPGRLDLFARGADNRLWQKFWDGSRWSGWILPVGNNGVLASSPSATSGALGRIDIAVRGADNGVYVLTYAGGWSNWGRMGSGGDVIQGRPSATSPGGTALRIAGRGSDNKAYLFVRN